MNTYSENVTASIIQLPFEKLPNIYVMDTDSGDLEVTLPPPSLDDATVGVINSGTGGVTVRGILADGSSYELTEQYQSEFFTVDADAQVWRRTSSAGGGSLSLETQAVKDLTNDEIIHLPTTPITVIAAPGANKLIVPTVIMLHMKWVADYGNIDATAMLKVDLSGNWTVGLRETVLSGISALLAGGGPDGTWVSLGLDNAIVQGVLTSVTPALNPHTHPIGADSGFYDADIVNVPLTISLDNIGSGILTGGNAGNVLQISVVYKVLDAVTGLFETFTVT